MRKGYSVESLKTAIVEAQADESSVRAVAKKHGIPSSTLHDHMSTTLLNKLAPVAQQFYRSGEKLLLLVFHLQKWDLE